MFFKYAQKALIGWKAHGPRIMRASFLTKKKIINVNILQCYAPTNDNKEDEKDNYYNRLSNFIQDRPKRNIIILMGEFNVRIGSDIRGYYKEILGSKDWSTENKIDHLCIARKFRRSLQDLRVKRGADVALDHHFIVARLKLKLKKSWAGGGGSQRHRYNTAALKDTWKQEKIKITLSNKFQILVELLEEETKEQMWQKVKVEVTSTCQKVLGYNIYTDKEWISAESLQKVAERREKKACVNNSRTRTAKVKTQEEYTEAHRSVKRSSRADKRNYLATLATEAAEAAYQNRTQDLYSIIRGLEIKFARQERLVRDKNGGVITDDEGQKMIGLSTSRSYSTGQLLRTYRRFR